MISLRTSIKHLKDIIFTPVRTLCLFSHRRHEPPKQDPYSLLKEDPIQVISDLWVRSFSDKTHKPFTNLTGFLSKLDLWVIAYQRSCADITGSYPSRAAIQSNVLQDLVSLRQAVIKNQFLWNEKTHLHIRAPNDIPSTKLISKRKFRSYLNSANPPFQDRVVQEMLLLILEPIFESRFSPKSHAFRPGRNAHSVIRSIRSNFAGYLWFLKVDVTEVFETIQLDTMMTCVGKSVKDYKALDLIQSGLETSQRKRVVDIVPEKKEFRRKKKIKKKNKSEKRRVLSGDDPKPDPYWLRTFFDFSPMEASQVPNYASLGILSPLLSNIYLNELDHWMEEKISEYFNPCEHDSIWKDLKDGNSNHNPSWPEFVPSSGKARTKKMDYIRYGGHLLIGIRGSRGDALRIRNEINEFIHNRYGLSLNESKFEIEHITRGILFLDHIICLRVIHPTLRYTSTGGEIVSKKVVGTLLSVTASLQRCIRLFRQLRFVKGDKDPEPLPCTPMLYAGQAHSNAQMNKFLETMADWYKYADNRKKIVAFCGYVIRSSLAKLYAARYKLKSRTKVYNMASRDLSRPLRKSGIKSLPDYEQHLAMGLVDPIEGVRFSHMKLVPSCDYTPLKRNWIPDHEKFLIEYSKLQDPRLFCDLLRSIKEDVGLNLPQDQIAAIVWDWKTVGIRRARLHH
ncbi:nuclear intron maturase 1, mitochondrial [Impatiens glandulifera]|uniref:nuclear intron maturase 1, mitochondrial n=1 Tax=Impatiens glandulifera TaxID=253017 RepID=UPI001FB1133E|nr:nuclear intron maturase 1, mitochondrial [Impatiens glandulifera]